MAVEVWNNGQSKVPVHIFPRKLGTKSMENLKKRYAENPRLIAFWNNLQKGYSYFEETKKLPKISVLDNDGYKINENQLGNHNFPGTSLPVKLTSTFRSDETDLSLL